MINVINDIMSSLKIFSEGLFTLYLVPNVSVGSLILLSLLFWVVCVNIWVRR